MRKPTCMLCGCRKLVLSETNIIGYDGIRRITNITLGCPKCGTEIIVKNTCGGADEQMEDFLKGLNDKETVYKVWE